MESSQKIQQKANSLANSIPQTPRKATTQKSDVKTAKRTQSKARGRPKKNKEPLKDLGSTTDFGTEGIGNDLPCILRRHGITCQKCINPKSKKTHKEQADAGRKCAKIVNDEFNFEAPKSDGYPPFWDVPLNKFGRNMEEIAKNFQGAVHTGDL